VKYTDTQLLLCAHTLDALAAGVDKALVPTSCHTNFLPNGLCDSAK
jgi:hypothetical protein